MTIVHPDHVEIIEAFDKGKLDLSSSSFIEKMFAIYVLGCSGRLPGYKMGDKGIISRADFYKMNQAN